MKATIVSFASLLAVATAQSLCAVNCFQSVVTEHPPLSCKEANMYLCFCKSQELQNYFAECAYSKCASEAEQTVNFGVNLCKDLGVPITPPTRPSSSSPAEKPSTSVPSSSSAAAASTTLSSAVQTTPATTANPSKPTSAESNPTSSLGTQSTLIVTSSTKQGSAPTNGTAQPTPTSVVVNKAVSMKAAPGVLAVAGFVALAMQSL